MTFINIETNHLTGKCILEYSNGEASLQFEYVRLHVVCSYVTDSFYSNIS